MPELPEVELFRRMLLPLVSASTSPCSLEVKASSETPPKKFLTRRQINFLSLSYYVAEVLRKGKVICMVLSTMKEKKAKDTTQYLYLHMGMTGRISTPTFMPKLESVSADGLYPPPHTHLILKSNGNEVSLSDPRRFGFVKLSATLSDFENLAPDGLNENLSLDGLIGKRKGIKALLLDQQAVVSGVGNWVADEVLYQSKVHPDQNLLTKEEVVCIAFTLKHILVTAVRCLCSDYKADSDRDSEFDGTRYGGFPKEWLFHYRWNKRKKKDPVQDANGNTIEFVTSAGRTSAIVPSQQKIFPRKKSVTKKKKKTHNDSEDETLPLPVEHATKEDRTSSKASRGECVGKEAQNKEVANVISRCDSSGHNRNTGRKKRMAAAGGGGQPGIVQKEKSSLRMPARLRRRMR